MGDCHISSSVSVTHSILFCFQEILGRWLSRWPAHPATTARNTLPVATPTPVLQEPTPMLLTSGMRANVLHALLEVTALVRSLHFVSRIFDSSYVLSCGRDFKMAV